MVGWGNAKLGQWAWVGHSGGNGDWVERGREIDCNEKRACGCGRSRIEGSPCDVRTRVSACVATHSGILFATDFTGFYIDAQVHWQSVQFCQQMA